MCANAQDLAGHLGHLLSMRRAHQGLGPHERAESQRPGSPDSVPALWNGKCSECISNEVPQVKL